MPELPDTVDGVDLELHPSRFQRSQWWHLVIHDLGVDPDGWWYGWCPLHDKEQDREVITGMYQFRAGVLRCLGEPPCHAPKRAMSLVNVATKIAHES